MGAAATTTELGATCELMMSGDYKERFRAEYAQTKIRYERLKAICTRIEAAEISGKPPVPHDCPLGLLRDQQRVMGEYLHILEIRAAIEEVTL